MKILIITDTHTPSINGVVTTITKTTEKLRNLGHEVCLIHPELFLSVPCPGYREIELSLNIWKMRSFIDSFNPDAVHIVVEGPLGLAARNYMQRKKIPYNTSYHTKFPEYLNKMFSIPTKWPYAYLKWFHGKSHRILVTTPSMREELELHGFKNCVVWSRGVDTDLYKPELREENFKKPVYLNVGRVSIEKNLEAFLSLDLDGTKVIVGDGPLLNRYKAKYPEVQFLGTKKGLDLAKIYASADVFVFPSKTDTFGIVQIESMASGTPVAAYPVAGPKDIIQNGINGSMDEDLLTAIQNCKSISRESCRKFALEMSWGKTTEVFLENLIQIK